MDSKLGKNYRAGVVGVFSNREGLVMVCERSDHQGSWQFPQGGIDSDESPDDALKREMREELGSDQFKIIFKSPHWTSYDFPSTMRANIAKNYHGQKHLWFHLRFLENQEPNLLASDGEFRAFRWVTAQEALALIVDWKKNIYQQGLEYLHLI